MILPVVVLVHTVDKELASSQVHNKYLPFNYCVEGYRCTSNVGYQLKN